MKKVQIQAYPDEMHAPVGHEKHEEWFDFCYREHFDEMLLTAYHYLNDKQDAEDLVSEIFEKVWSARINHWDNSFLREQKQIRAYLLMAVKNGCIDRYRRRSRQTGIISMIKSSLPRWNSPEVYSKFETEALTVSMEFLSKREKEIILAHLNGLKLEEIAEHLQLSKLTVRNTLQNARTRIRKVWKIFMQ